MFITYVTANVKYFNAFAYMTYLHKIVVFHIFNCTCRLQLSYVNMLYTHMRWLPAGLLYVCYINGVPVGVGTTAESAGSIILC